MIDPWENTEYTRLKRKAETQDFYLSILAVLVIVGLVAITAVLAYLAALEELERNIPTRVVTVGSPGREMPLTPIEWDNIEPRRVLATLPVRKPGVIER